MKGFKGKKQEDKPTYKGIVFDSYDEMYFYCWCEELLNDKIIKEFVFQPPPFQLSEQVKAENYKQYYLTARKKVLKEREISINVLNDHKYTADFLIVFTSEAFEKVKLFFDLAKIKIIANEAEGSEEVFIFVDCKPKNFKMKNMDTIFSINRKWVFQDYGVYIHKVYFKDWFQATFAPIMYLLAGKKDSSKFINHVDFKRKYFSDDSK